MIDLVIIEFEFLVDWFMVVTCLDTEFILYISIGLLTLDACIFTGFCSFGDPKLILPEPVLERMSWMLYLVVKSIEFKLKFLLGWSLMMRCLNSPLFRRDLSPLSC